MYILFDARCPACGHAFQVEADCDRDLHPKLGRFAYACPRCRTENTARTDCGALSATSVSTAVRVTGPAGARPPGA